MPETPSSKALAPELVALVKAIARDMVRADLAEERKRAGLPERPRGLPNDAVNPRPKHEQRRQKRWTAELSTAIRTSIAAGAIHARAEVHGDGKIVLYFDVVGTVEMRDGWETVLVAIES